MENKYTRKAICPSCGKEDIIGEVMFPFVLRCPTCASKIVGYTEKALREWASLMAEDKVEEAEVVLAKEKK